MQGFANVEPASSADPDSFQFANALIRLTYSNAAGFLGISNGFGLRPGSG